jgi:aminoglycoside phosphotransferase (APT) family kinase protein
MNGAGPSPPEPVAGIRAQPVGAWLASQAPAVRPPLSFELFAGGRSNLTFLVRDAAGAAWVLRRPPLSGVLPSAHDMAREYRIISALRGTAVPVPGAVGLCQDPAVTGAPFYVMDYVDGVVPRDQATVERSFDPRRRAAVTASLVDALVALHGVDPDAVGLGELGRREAYVERQLRRWGRQWEQSKTRELPAIDEVGRRLAARVPPQQGPAAIVHGDYRLDNLILSPAGEVVAVLDWELCTLGDPLADVGLLMVYWSEPGDQVQPLSSAPTAMPGFPSRAEVAAAYAAGSGRDLSELDFYVALGYWKLAVILEGVYARSAMGAYGRGDDSYTSFAAVVTQLAERAAEATAHAGR